LNEEDTQHKIVEAVTFLTGTCSTVEDAAKILGIDPQRVRLFCRNGTLRAFKWSSTWIITKTSLIEYVERREAERQELLVKRARLSDVQALEREVRELARKLNVPWEDIGT
jgi:hypothetical protein